MSHPNSSLAGKPPSPDQLDARIVDLLGRDRDDDRDAFEQLVPLVYDQLHGIARRLRQRRFGPPTFNTTAIVHEAYLRLRQYDGGYRDRSHFFAVAARAMRQLLIDEARRMKRAKRGDGLRPLTLQNGDLAIEYEVENLLAVNRALERLGRSQPRWVQVVECRYFGGLTEEDTALALGVSGRTVRRDWTKARAWLTVELGGREAMG